jgi:hypothetical protein
MDYSVASAVVRWEKYGFDYTFIVFALRKAGAAVE